MKTLRHEQDNRRPTHNRMEPPQSKSILLAIKTNIRNLQRIHIQRLKNTILLMTPDMPIWTLIKLREDHSLLRQELRVFRRLQPQALRMTIVVVLEHRGMISTDRRPHRQELDGQVHGSATKHLDQEATEGDKTNMN